MKNRDFESNISNCIHNMNQNAQNILKLDKKHTQEEHANEIQATQPIISMYKNGKRDIDLRFFVYLHTEFGFSLDQLINSILTESEIMMHLQSSGSVAVPPSEDRSREFIDIRKYTGLYFAYYYRDPITFLTGTLHLTEKLATTFLTMVLLIFMKAIPLPHINWKQEPSWEFMIRTVLQRYT